MEKTMQLLNLSRKCANRFISYRSYLGNSARLLCQLVSTNSFWHISTKDFLQSRKLVKVGAISIKKHFSSNAGSFSGANIVNPNLYTEKLWEIMSKLPGLAEEYRMQSIDSILVLKALLEESSSELPRRVFEKAGIESEHLLR